MRWLASRLCRLLARVSYYLYLHSRKHRNWCPCPRGQRSGKHHLLLNAVYGLINLKNRAQRSSAKQNWSLIRLHTDDFEGTYPEIVWRYSGYAEPDVWTDEGKVCLILYIHGIMIPVEWAMKRPIKQMERIPCFVTSIRSSCSSSYPPSC